jgi:hypothetical protein
LGKQLENSHPSGTSASIIDQFSVASDKALRVVLLAGLTHPVQASIAMLVASTLKLWA